MALFQCVLAVFVAAGVAVQPEAPVRRHREQVAQHEAEPEACTTNLAFDGGGANWLDRCKTLDECRSSCNGDCVAFNWWPVKGGCRHYVSKDYTTRVTEHVTVGGLKGCTLDNVDTVGPTDCTTCPAPKCQQATATEITISSIKASSASCDGCTSGTGCDPRGPNRLISPCNSTVCQTTWGCGGSCTADTLTVNGNGQGEWCSRGGSASKTGGQWLDLDLGSSYSVTKFEIWSGASGNRFPQSMQILTGGSINDGSTGGGNGCFDKSTSTADATGGWSAVAGPFVTGQGTSLTGCANARSRAGVNTQTDSDKCEVPVSDVTGQYIRIWFEGTAGNDDYMELRAIKVFGTQA